MRYAKSMYRGGLIVDSDECDYESSRHLGIICPFCSQAVFLRKGGSYIRDGKEITVSPAFCHYQSNDTTAQDCELRSLRREGEEYIKRLEIESRGQRLELYNKRLWEIFKQDIKVTSLKEATQSFGKKWIEEKASLTRNDLSNRLKFYLEQSLELWEQQLTEKVQIKDPKLAEAANVAWTVEERLADIRKLSSFDRQLHVMVFQEIIQFLSTRSGNYAYHKIFQVALIIDCANIWVAKVKTKAPQEAINAYANYVKKDFNVEFYNIMILLMLIRTDWINLFYSLENAK